MRCACRRSGSGRGRLHPLSDLCRGLRRSGLLRLDGGLDGEVLRLLTHQDCGSGHRKDNSKHDRRRDPEQALRLGDFGAWSNRALHLRVRSGRQAGAVELRRHFGRFGPLPRFIVTACDNGRRVERAPVVGLVRSDRLGRVERRQSGQTFILAVLRSHRRSGPAGLRSEGRLVGHCSSQLGSSRRSHRRRRCGWPPGNRGWRLLRAPGRLGLPLRRQRRSLRRALNGHGCGPGLAWRTGLRRRSRRRSGRPGRRRRAGALDRRECWGRGRRSGPRRRDWLSGYRRGRRRRRRSERRSRVLRTVSFLNRGDRCVKRALLASDVALRQRRPQASELLDQGFASTFIDRSARRRCARVGQIGDGSHEQRMIISHEASAQPLRATSRRGPLVLEWIMHKDRIVALRTRRQ